MKSIFKKWDLSAVYKCLLVLLDIIFINLSSFMALFVRFNLHLEEIPPEYMNSVYELALMNTIVTVILFAVAKLYSSSGGSRV